MPRVTVNVRDGLEDLLKRGLRRPVVVTAAEGATAGSIVEDLGIPHTEIGGVTVNGQACALTRRPADGDEMTVAPRGRETCGGASPTRFILDVHLGKLARLLRLLGFDTAWSRDAGDAHLAATAARENRILLSRDRGLLKRREVRKGCLVRSQDPRRQLDEVAERYGLRGRLSPFSRCLVCNAPLRLDAGAPIDRGAGGGSCPSCGRRYWRGSHWRSMNAIVEEISGGASRPPSPHPRKTARM